MPQYNTSSKFKRENEFSGTIDYQINGDNVDIEEIIIYGVDTSENRDKLIENFSKKFVTYTLNLVKASRPLIKSKK